MSAAAADDDAASSFVGTSDSDRESTMSQEEQAAVAAGDAAPANEADELAGEADMCVRRGCGRGVALRAGGTDDPLLHGARFDALPFLTPSPRPGLPAGPSRRSSHNTTAQKARRRRSRTRLSLQQGAAAATVGLARRAARLDARQRVPLLPRPRLLLRPLLP